MAGRPLTQAGVDKLNTFSLEDIERRIFDRLADGVTVRELAEECGVTKGAFYEWKKQDPALAAAWDAALKARAETFAEDGIQILDDLTKVRIWTDSDGKEHRIPLTAEEIRLAEARVKHRVWLASVSDRERFGQKSEVNVNLTVSGLHLTATRSVEALFDAEDADFEVVEEPRRLPPPKRRMALDFLDEESPVDEAIYDTPPPRRSRRGLGFIDETTKINRRTLDVSFL